VANSPNSFSVEANLSFHALAPHRIMGTEQASGEQCLQLSRCEGTKSD
jgi:hypothetical protein